jgi:hypothetical protein
MIEGLKARGPSYSIRDGDGNVMESPQAVPLSRITGPGGICIRAVLNRPFRSWDWQGSRREQTLDRLKPPVFRGALWATDSPPLP